MNGVVEWWSFEVTGSTGCLWQGRGAGIRECLYPRARVVAPLVRRLWPDFFEEDLTFIRYLGTAKGLGEAQAESRTFQDENQVAGGFLRVRLKMRVSGRKATRLALEVFSDGGAE
jgi:hypothetical protein